MITKGLTAKLQASWDTQGLHGESRNKMPELWQASERNYRGDLIMTRKYKRLQSVTHQCRGTGERFIWMQVLTTIVYLVIIVWVDYYSIIWKILQSLERIAV